MHSWLPDWVVESFSQEEGDRDPHFIYRPPPPDPEWHPVPADSLRATDDIAPEELRKQLVTVKVSGLGEELTPELLFRFLVRGKRLHPRPLAIRRLDEVEDGCFIVEGGEQIDHEAKPFLVAFKSLEDAQRAIDYSNNKQLPDVPSGCCNWLTLSFAAPWPPPPPKPTPPFDPSSTATTAEAAVPPTLTPHERHLQLIKASDAELALGWKWGEVSGEVRTSWLTRRRLPTSKRCPPRDIRSAGDDWNISEEYDEELERIFNPTDPLVRMKASLRVEIAKEKKVIYKERCDAYNKWADKVDPKNVDPNDPFKPEIPTYPFDSVALERIEARKQVEREKAARELEESMARMRETFALSEQIERDRIEQREKRWAEEEARREKNRQTRMDRLLFIAQQMAASQQELKEKQEAQPAEEEAREGASVVTEMTAAEQRQKRREELASMSLSTFGFTIKPGISKYGAGSPAPTTSTPTDTTAATSAFNSTQSASSSISTMLPPQTVAPTTAADSTALAATKMADRRKRREEIAGMSLSSILGRNVQTFRSASSAPPPGPSAARIAHLSSLDNVDIPGPLRSTAAPSPAPPVTP